MKHRGYLLIFVCLLLGSLDHLRVDSMSLLWNLKVVTESLLIILLAVYFIIIQLEKKAAE